MTSFRFQTRNAVMRGFFDRKLITDRVDKAERRELNRIGGFTRKVARRSLRKRAIGRVSSPGQPPFSHGPQHLLRNNIFYAYDSVEGSVYIGPVALSTRLPYMVQKVLEEGGTVIVRRQMPNGELKTIRMSYKARPYMGPANEVARRKFPEFFANSL